MLRKFGGREIRILVLPPTLARGKPFPPLAPGRRDKTALGQRLVRRVVLSP